MSFQEDYIIIPLNIQKLKHPKVSKWYNHNDVENFPQQDWSFAIAFEKRSLWLWMETFVFFFDFEMQIERFGRSLMGY